MLIEFVMKLLVIVPGFGDPHWDTKVDILRKNIASVSAHFHDYAFHIIQYTQGKQLPNDILANPNITVIHDKGILGRNIHVHAPPSILDTHNPDYVMILLDDIELETPFDWEHMLIMQKELDLDISSPVLTNSKMSYWPFMIHNNDPALMAQITTRCELFCYLMTPVAYRIYYKFCDPENPWMWGMDFMLNSHMGMRVGILNRVRMMHHFWRTEDTNDPNHCPRKDCDIYLAKHNTSWEELHALPTTLQIAVARAT